MSKYDEAIEEFKRYFLSDKEIQGYGVSFDENGAPFIFVNVKNMRSHDKLVGELPCHFRDMAVKIQIAYDSDFL